MNMRGTTCSCAPCLCVPRAEELKTHRPEFTIVSAPEFQADPQRDGTNSEAFILVNFTRKIVLIGGTKYAGEMKKSIFGIMNFLLPQSNVFPMHCSANVGKDGETRAVLRAFGHGQDHAFRRPGAPADRRRRARLERRPASSTLKAAATPSASSCRRRTSRRSGTRSASARCWKMWRSIPTRTSRITTTTARTENTRAAYPVDFIDNAVIPGIGGHPKNVIFLTADAFGVLPPISRLTPEQAMYHFLSGYTAKVAGTEAA